MTDGGTFYQHVATAEQPRGDVAAQLLRERQRRIDAEMYVSELNRQLSRQNRASRIVDMAIRDARELLLRRSTNFPISQIAMQRDGLSRRRWQWAIAVLRYCTILSIRGRRFSFRWFSQDHVELFQMFAEGQKRLESAERPLESLRFCLPTSARNK